LAASIVKLWEKCEIAKIAVKRGVQNTNSEMMAEELKVGNNVAYSKTLCIFKFLPPQLCLMHHHFSSKIKYIHDA
jgi:hypothetical protein